MDGRVTQRFYDAGGGWTGEENRDLPYDIESLQLAVGLSLGFHL